MKYTSLPMYIAHSLPVCSGFSGVTANFFPWLMVWLCNNQHAPWERRVKVQQFLSVADRVIAHKYPTSSKYYLATHYRAPIQPVSRVHSVSFNDQDVCDRPSCMDLSSALSLPQALSLQSLHQMMLDLCQELSILPVNPRAS